MVTESGKAANEAQVRKLIDEWATAFRARDVERVLSCYAPDIVAFDIVPPLQYRGIDTYRQDWERTMAMCDGPLGCEMRDLTVVAGDDAAFCHSLNHVTGKRTDGGAIDAWMRVTVCFGKVDGKWLAVHEHVSVPIDMDSGAGMFNLQPQ